MINFDYIATQNIKEHNTNQPEIPDHQYTMLIIGGSRSGKTTHLI